MPAVEYANLDLGNLYHYYTTLFSERHAYLIEQLKQYAADKTVTLENQRLILQAMNKLQALHYNHRFVNNFNAGQLFDYYEELKKEPTFKKQQSLPLSEKEKSLVRQVITLVNDLNAEKHRVERNFVATREANRNVNTEKMLESYKPRQLGYLSIVGVSVGVAFAAPILVGIFATTWLWLPLIASALLINFAVKVLNKKNQEAAHFRDYNERVEKGTNEQQVGYEKNIKGAERAFDKEITQIIHTKVDETILEKVHHQLGKPSQKGESKLGAHWFNYFRTSAEEKDVSRKDTKLNEQHSTTFKKGTY